MIENHGKRNERVCKKHDQESGRNLLPVSNLASALQEDKGIYLVLDSWESLVAAYVRDGALTSLLGGGTKKV